MNKSGKIVLLIGLLILALSIFLFFMIVDERNNIQALYFSFIIFSEMVLFGGVSIILGYSKEKEKIIFYSGNIFSLISYTVISVITSLLYLCNNWKGIKSFWSIQVALFIIFMIFVTLFSFIAATVKSKKEIK